MKSNRRNFMKSLMGTAAFAGIPLTACNSKSDTSINYEPFDTAAARPVLKREYFSAPVVIDSIELLRYKKNYLCRVRSKEGAVGYSVSNNMHIIYLYPLLLHKIAPFFIGKDARDLDSLIDEVYIDESNYKLQGLAFWIPLATVEFAILDMLGRLAGKTLGQLIGDVKNRQIAVYQANNYRGKTAEESIKLIKKTVEESGAKAIKFKVGGRMRNNADYPPGRTKKLIPLVRETFGDKMVIYADSNGSYTVDKAIEVGRLMEKYHFDFYEEPVPFDWLEETKMVADALKIPIAGGEQETSLHRFRWMIANDCLQVVQPDIFYFGGMIRSVRVARMAEVKGLLCTPHISGSGMGYLYMSQFVSAIPNPGPYHEFKGFNQEIPFHCGSATLQSENGILTVPSEPGMGIEIDPDFIKKHKLVEK
ncbi:mandelate racemase/muconate lactonizing enzyme family protein [candidate division KSB1 bacterium]|nr:mandelate racemase/muconate lactonizing enzyme family protein [candidate division KSB1 bacterium]